MAKKREIHADETVECPYCGNRGRAFHCQGSLLIAHKVEKRTFVGKATGALIPYASFVDGCSSEGRIGSDNIAKEEEVEEL